MHRILCYEPGYICLKAAALTYVASSLFSLVNMWRWIRLIRR
ncbi:MAG: zinc metallopeptidase [Nitrospirota bacterium]|nr:zinc metallopeptidase [Nitrospirota bacterium]MDH5585653.1 zinc metallopeptidase [Nitrospirota bacterium]MDH5775613.1 zinc metallopeptidase [Nitrospirota bacterium]